MDRLLPVQAQQPHARRQQQGPRERRSELRTEPGDRIAALAIAAHELASLVIELAHDRREIDRLRNGQ
jgi:hypothetical protein